MLLATVRDHVTRGYWRADSASQRHHLGAGPVMMMKADVDVTGGAQVREATHPTSWAPRQVTRASGLVGAVYVRQVVSGRPLTRYVFVAQLTRVVFVAKNSGAIFRILCLTASIVL